jgi:aryl-alcohol dehydrogenase-like predicted oxidoreductase
MGSAGHMIDRRHFIGIAAGGAALALTPQLLRAFEQQGGRLIQRAIPSSGEMLPVIGLSFSNHPACAAPAALRQVLKTMIDNGGTVFDAMHGNIDAELFHANVANELGVQNKVFWSTRGTPPGGSGGPPQPGAATVKAHIDTWLARVKASRMDLVMVPPQGDATWLAALKEEKKAGRVRYIGVQVIGDNVYPQLESVMRNEPIDFIGVDYDISNRARVEETILPLAVERKIGVMAFFPLGNNGGVSCGNRTNLFARVGSRPLPEWAADFDAHNWAQFFLKYVVSHPAVTVARVGTTQPAHMLEDIGGGIGRLPDEATRKRMVAFFDALPSVSEKGAPAPQGPGVISTAVLDRYVGEYKTGAGAIVSVRRYGSMLVAKAGPNPDIVLIARTNTRFSLGHRGPDLIEFQPDNTGNVALLVYEQGNKKIPAARIR